MYTPWMCWKNPTGCIELVLTVPVQRGRTQYWEIFAEAWLERAGKESVTVTGRCRPEPVMPFSPFSDAFLRGSQSFGNIKTEQPVLEEIGSLLPPCLPRLFSPRLQGAPARNLRVLEQLCVTWQRSVAQSCHTPTAQIWALGKWISRVTFLQLLSPQLKITSQPAPGSELY